MNKTHIIYCPVTGVGKNPYKGNEWFLDRVNIFKNYTLKSLLNQTNKHFLLWLSFRPEERENPLIADLRYVLKGCNYVFSYNGLMYFDDKNEQNNLTLIDRLQKSLNKISTLQGDFIYLTRIDSDDMFHKDVVQLIQDQEPSVKALTLQNGFVYNKDTNEVAEWNPLTNPPFHTIIFPREVFFDANKHIDWYEGFKSHEDIARLPHKVLWRGDNRLDRLYMVLTHDPKMHISTSWSHPFKGQLVDIDLKEFGI